MELIFKMIMWLIGLSGSGKTTLGNALCENLRSKEINVVHLDGDLIRELFQNDLSHSIDDRMENSKRLMKLSEFLDINKINVVCSVVSLFPEHRQQLRRTVSDYFEVFVDTNLNVLKQRDSKGLYKKFDQGALKNLAGLDLHFPRPTEPDLLISNNDTIGKFLDNVTYLVRQFKT